MVICEAETPRLWLRPLVEDDLEDYHAIWSRPEATRWTSRGKPFQTIDESRHWTANILPSGSLPHTYAVLLRPLNTILNTGKSNARMIGIIGVLCDPPEVGYIFNPDFWGRGYANETLSAFLHLYWSKVVDKELKAIVQEGNTASIRLLVQNGFTEKSRTQDENGNNIIQFEILRPHQGIRTS